MNDFSRAVDELRERLDREQRQREGREDPGVRNGRNRISGKRELVPAGPAHVYRRPR